MDNFRKQHVKSKNIKVKDFITFCSIAKNQHVIYDEFKAIEERRIYSKVPDFRMFEDRNQFKYLLPYCHNRVKLKPNTYCKTDYINATHIKGYKLKKHYIATQHPLVNTVYDFWHMVIQNNCRTIVMLTQQCNQSFYKYYPDLNVRIDFNDISIYNLKQKNCEAYQRRILLVSKSGETRVVMHYHLLTWSNVHGLKDEIDLFGFIHSIRRESDATCPIVVHSSSGVGRTGVYIALDMILDQARLKKYVNIYKSVAKLCKERYRMIYTFEQYRLIYELMDTCILHTVGKIKW